MLRKYSGIVFNPYNQSNIPDLVWLMINCEKGYIDYIVLYKSCLGEHY